jgi:hypothetical protein
VDYKARTIHNGLYACDDTDRIQKTVELGGIKYKWAYSLDNTLNIMRLKKLTQQQRIGRLEKVVSQLFILTKKIEGEIKVIQDKTGYNKDEEE